MQDNWEHVRGTGLWAEYVNKQTGESSLKEHTLKTVWTSCPAGDCYFELVDSGRRECVCNKCGSIKTFVVGISKLVDGKIIPVREM